MIIASIGASRIQSWLARTPRLRLLRGASKALHGGSASDSAEQTPGTLLGLTSAASVDKWCQGRSVSRHEPAGERDGVIVLEGNDPRAMESDVRDLLNTLRDRLPGLQWDAWWVEAQTLLHATALARSGAESVRHMTTLPTLNDFPLAAQCDGCRAEPRLPSERSTADGTWHLGADCGTRDDYANAYQLSDEDFFTGAVDRLATRGGLTLGGVVGRGDSSNHVAIVRADGNRIGSFFAQLDASPLPLPDLRAHAIRDLNEATQRAVRQGLRAARWTQGDQTRVPGVLVHYMGGDDVLVSVAAPLAWEFGNALVHGFEGVRDTWRSRLATDREAASEAGTAWASADADRLEALIGKVSLGVGMVFAHRSHPFADAWALAGEAEAAAKHFTKGEHSAFAWFDITAGTEHTAGAGEWTQVLTAHEVSRELGEPTDARGDVDDGTGTDAELARRRAFRELRGLPSSARHRLESVLRDHPHDPAGAAAAWAKRLGQNYAAVQALADAGRVNALLAITSQLRWWPARDDSTEGQR